MPLDAYMADLATTGRSSVHIARFLQNTLGLVAQVRASARYAFLLAHGMGNHALSCALPDLFAPAGAATPATCPEDKFRGIDRTEVFDYFGLIPPVATRQYHRRSKAVRAGIVRAMAGRPPPAFPR